MLIPVDNEKDLVEIPDNIKGKLDIRTVKWIDEVLQYALVRQPTPLPAVAGVAAVTAKAGAVAAKRARRARKSARIVRPH